MSTFPQIDVDAAERPLVDGPHASVEVVTNGDGVEELLFSSTAEYQTVALNDPWWLPADPALLRGMAADLTAAADALDEP